MASSANFFLSIKSPDLLWHIWNIQFSWFSLCCIFWVTTKKEKEGRAADLLLCSKCSYCVKGEGPTLFIQGWRILLGLILSRWWAKSKLLFSNRSYWLTPKFSRATFSNLWVIKSSVLSIGLPKRSELSIMSGMVAAMVMSQNLSSLHREKCSDLRLLGSIWFKDTSVLLSSVVTAFQ